MKGLISAIIALHLMVSPSLYSKKGADTATHQCSDQIEAQASAEDITREELVVIVKELIFKNKSLPNREEIKEALVRQKKLTSSQANNLCTREKVTKADMKSLLDEVQTISQTELVKNHEDLVKFIGSHMRTHLLIPNEDEMSAKFNIDPDNKNFFKFAYYTDGNSLPLEEAQKTAGYQAGISYIRNAYIKLSRALDFQTVKSGQLLVIQLQEKNPDLTSKTFFAQGQPYQSIEEVFAEAKNTKPESFKKIMDTYYFNDDREKALLHALKTKRTLIFSTILAKTEVDKEQLAALLNYAERNDGAVFLHVLNNNTNELDEAVLDHPNIHILTKAYWLSPRWYLSNITVMGKAIRPLTGTRRAGGPGVRQIMGAHNAWIETNANNIEHSDLVKQAMTSGALFSWKAYLGGAAHQQRTAGIAQHDHYQSALVLEKTCAQSTLLGAQQQGSYHPRHIVYVPERKGFGDRHHFYTADSVEPLEYIGVIPGDLHLGDTDPLFIKAFEDQILDEFDPKVLLGHDVLNGHSINGHESEKPYSLAARAQQGRLNLEVEMAEKKAFINSLLAQYPQLKYVQVRGNHDEWIARAIESGKVDPHDWKAFEYFKKLEYWRAQGKDLLKETVREGLQYPERADVLAPNENFVIGPRHRLVEVGQHGDVGNNGGRGISLQTAVETYGSIVYGHTHGFNMFNGAVNVGTGTYGRVGYTERGGSSWTQAVALVDENGIIHAKQLHRGRFYRAEDAEVLPADQFFLEGYPFAVDAPPPGESSNANMDTMSTYRGQSRE